MKRIVRIILIIVFLFPLSVLALNGSFYLNKTSMTIESGKSSSFILTANNSAGKVVFSSNNINVCTIDKTSVWLDKDSVTVTVTAVSSGKCVISVNINGASYDETAIITTKTINVNVSSPKSTINTLSDLKIDGITVSGFSSSKLSYTLNDNSRTNINISATASDVKASVSGTGKKELKYGENIFYIIVTAENGNKRTYTISINKIDSRSENNYLKMLSIDKGTINFDKNTTNYTINLEHEINEINITAISEDSKANISGLGKKELVDYTNDFIIIVTAENGSTREYLLKVIRKDKDGMYNKPNEDNSVKSISIENYDFIFRPEVKKYNILVEKVDELKINVIPNDINASINILNNKDLKLGLNIVTVQVIAENGTINEYLFNVYKFDENEIKNQDLEKEEKSDKANFNWMIFSIILFILLFILTTIFGIYYLNNKKLRKM